MAIIVEDGTRVTGANSYVTEAELTAYATARGITLTGDTEELLIKGMDYIEGLGFIGIKIRKDQPVQWPRANAYVDSYLLDTDEIPTELKEGLMEVAIAIDSGENPLADVARTKKSASVGPVSVEYTDGSSSTTIVRKINNKLRKLLGSGSTSGNSFEVIRR